MKIRSIRLAVASAASLLSGAFAVAQTPPSNPCPAPANWFPHAQTPEPNPNTFPGSSATNCDFHQWAWQMFLWLTQEENGQLRFINFPTDVDLFDPANPAKKPLALAAVRSQKGKEPIKLKLRGLKPMQGGIDVNSPDRVVQASGGILVGLDHRPIYYSVHFDPTFYQFVQANGYYDYSTYIKAAPTTDFPPGATELKASWRIVAPGSDAGGAYTTLAEIPALKQDPKTGAITVDTSKPPQTATVALVGLHVVGVVANHPEFIWATFEPISNAPILPANVQPGANTPVSNSNFTFYAAGTLASACNVAPKKPILDPVTQTFAQVTPVFLQFPQGGRSTENIANIDALNQSVHSQLASAEVWKNYNLIGGVWLLPGALKPNMAPKGADLHGSPNLANDTMETFVQNGFSPPPPGQLPTVNCFTCHNTQKTSTAGTPRLPIPAMNMNLSHILTDGLVTRETALRKLKAAK